MKIYRYFAVPALLLVSMTAFGDTTVPEAVEQCMETYSKASCSMSSADVGRLTAALQAAVKAKAAVRDASSDFAAAIATLKSADDDTADATKAYSNVFEAYGTAIKAYGTAATVYSNADEGVVSKLFGDAAVAYETMASAWQSFVDVDTAAATVAAGVAADTVATAADSAATHFITGFNVNVNVCGAAFRQSPAEGTCIKPVVAYVVWNQCVIEATCQRASTEHWSDYHSNVVRSDSIEAIQALQNDDGHLQ